MESITIDKLLELVKSYNEEEIERVYFAYRLAEESHKGQKRNSGEEYITHPLTVTYILALLNADGDTLCAGLLHDTVEDTEITKEEIARLFNPEVAELVDGVTKISKMNFSTKEEANNVNTRKIIESIYKDPRIIIIKLADRLHNMSTLDFKSPTKQKEKAWETLDIFVPLAYYTGIHYLKTRLEDLSLKYLEPEKYKEIKEERTKYKQENKELIEDMVNKIQAFLKQNNITGKIKVRIKSIYGIYQKLEQGINMQNIHDLISVKVIVDSDKECYDVLGTILRLSPYHTYDPYFRNYLSNPKEDGYSSLHTTIFIGNGRLVQLQITTAERDKINTYGIAAYWQQSKGMAKIKMKEDMKRFLFAKALEEMSIIEDDRKFLKNVRNEVFGKKIIVYTANGSRISLPKGSTVVDFVFASELDNGYNIKSIQVNNKEVPPSYILQPNDIVYVVTDKVEFYKPNELLEYATTNHAIRILKRKLENKM